MGGSCPKTKKFCCDGNLIDQAEKKHKAGIEKSQPW
jgi:hypothetical protein